MRQSTTQKLSYKMAKRTRWFIPDSCGMTSRECGSDGIIVRLRGVEYAIVAYDSGHFIPCPKLHPNTGPIHYASVTVRRGLVQTDTEYDSMVIGQMLLNESCKTEKLVDELWVDGITRYTFEKIKIVKNMILESYDEGNRLKFEVGKAKQFA
jgi:hypothetical protein